MLHIKIVMPYQGRAGFAKHLRNNPEYVRKLDKKNETVWLNPYIEKDWFRLTFIENLLEDGFIKDGMWDVELENNGIHYMVEKATCEELLKFKNIRLC